MKNELRSTTRSNKRRHETAVNFDTQYPMQRVTWVTWRDILNSVMLGVLVGWLLISIHDPEHKRFKFELSQTDQTVSWIIG